MGVRRVGQGTRLARSPSSGASSFDLQHVPRHQRLAAISLRPGPVINDRVGSLYAQLIRNWPPVVLVGRRLGWSRHDVRIHRMKLVGNWPEPAEPPTGGEHAKCNDYQE